MSDKENEWLSPMISITNLAGGPFDDASLGLSQWKFQDILKSEFAYANMAMIAHLMNGLILLLIDEDMVWNEIEKESYLSDVPDGSSKEGTKISMFDVGVRDFSTLAVFAIQSIAKKRKIKLDEDGIKSRFRALIGFSLNWVKIQESALDVALHYQDIVLKDVIESTRVDSKKKETRKDSKKEEE